LREQRSLTLAESLAPAGFIRDPGRALLGSWCVVVGSTEARSIPAAVSFWATSFWSGEKKKLNPPRGIRSGLHVACDWLPWRGKRHRNG
jgi:hypothetical protein